MIYRLAEKYIERVVSRLFSKPIWIFRPSKSNGFERNLPSLNKSLEKLAFGNFFAGS
jgi:hypothetical protein